MSQDTTAKNEISEAQVMTRIADSRNKIADSRNKKDISYNDDAVCSRAVASYRDDILGIGEVSQVLNDEQKKAFLSSFMKEGQKGLSRKEVSQLLRKHEQSLNEEDLLEFERNRPLRRKIRLELVLDGLPNWVRTVVILYPEGINEPDEAYALNEDLELFVETQLSIVKSGLYDKLIKALFSSGRNVITTPWVDKMGSLLLAPIGEVSIEKKPKKGGGFWTTVTLHPRKGGGGIKEIPIVI